MLGLAVFAVALYLPAFECRPYYHSSNGLHALVLGAIGMLFGDFGWLANPMLFAMLFRLTSVGLGAVFPESSRPPPPSRWYWLLLPVLASSLAASTFDVSAPVCGNGGDISDSRAPVGLASGGYVWVGTVWLVSIYAIAGEIAYRAKAKRNFDGVRTGDEAARQR
jgi:hypothetical protein